MSLSSDLLSSQFDGFVVGVDLTPVPSPLLAEVLVDLNDLNELKLVLRIIWLLHKKAASNRFLTIDELASDEITANFLGLHGDELVKQIEMLIKNLCQRKILLLVYAKADIFFMLNNEPARQLVRSGQFLPTNIVTNTEAVPASNFEHGSNKIVSAYEQNIGALSPVTSERLSELLYLYSEMDILEAIKIAAVNGARSLNYINAVLRRNGKRFGKNKRGSDEVPELSEAEYFAQRDDI